MRFRHSSGAWGVVAVLVFLLPGVGVIVATLLEVIDAGTNTTAALLGLGGVMITIGAAAALWRIELVIDGASRTVTENRWLMGFKRGETYDFESIERIEIDQRPRQAERYEVWLNVSDGRLYVEEYTGHERARECAERVSGLTGLPIEDLVAAARE